MNKIILTIIFLLTSNLAYAAFPSDGVLDDFNRANSSTTLGGNWTVSTNANWGNDAAGINSNTAYIASFTNGSSALWSASSFSGTLEAYVTYSTATAGSFISGLVCQDGVNTTNNGYFIGMGGGSGAIRVYILTASVLTQIFTFTQALSAGDSIGFTLTPSGLFTVYYKPNGGSWSSIGTVTDTTYSCTNIGINLSDTTVRLDNFGGGTASQVISGSLLKNSILRNTVFK